METKFKQTEIGKIPEDWDVKRLKDVCIKITDGSHFSPPTKFNGKLIATVKDMENYGFNYLTCRKISKEDFENLVKQDCKPLKNDVLIAKDGSYLKHVFVSTGKDEIVLLSSIAILRPDQEKISSSFLKYLFTDAGTKERVSGNYVSGAVIPRIVLRDFEKIELPIPSLSEQLSIAKILSSLDAKIELNNKMNKTLETIGQLLYKRWFVDERKDEWKNYKFVDLVNQLKPGTNYQPDRIAKGIPFVNVRNVQGGFLDLRGVKYISREEYKRVHNIWLPEENDLLITRIGTLGNVGVIRKEDLPVAVHYNSIDIKQKDLSYQFLYFLLKSNIFQEQYSLKTKQSVQEYITIEDVENISIVLPEDLSEIKDLERTFIVLFNQIRTNYNNNQTLSSIRDVLLPKLMSGEIRVK